MFSGTTTLASCFYCMCMVCVRVVLCMCVLCIIRILCVAMMALHLLASTVFALPKAQCLGVGTVATCKEHNNMYVHIIHIIRKYITGKWKTTALRESPHRNLSHSLLHTNKCISTCIYMYVCACIYIYTTTRTWKANVPVNPSATPSPTSQRPKSVGMKGFIL